MGGGDFPGMNAAIRSATLVGIPNGIEIFGIERGYAGLIEGACVPITARIVDPVIRDGGTIIGTVRPKEFMTQKGRNQARDALSKAGIQNGYRWE